MNNHATTWVKEYGDMLYRFAYVRVNDRIVAEDLVQDTFVSALKGYDSFEQRSSEKSWLFSILKHKIIDYYRAKGRNQVDTIESEDVIDSLFDNSGHWKSDVPFVSWKTTPEEDFQNDEFRGILQKCVAHLSDVQKKVFSFRDLDGLSGEDICKLLDISSSNLWVITHRARHALRDCLTKNWFGGQA